MSTAAWAIVVICLVVVLVGCAVLAAQVGRSSRLKRRFGPEYDRLVETTGDRKQAEAALADLVRSRKALPVTSLNDDERRTFGTRWTDVQARFVDDPTAATAEADRLVVEVMTARGYRTQNPAFGSDDGFDERAGLLSCDHPEVTAGYRSAHATRMSARATDTGEHTTEKLRTALVHYRTVFMRLVDEEGDGARAARAGTTSPDAGATGAKPTGARPADTGSHPVSST